MKIENSNNTIRIRFDGFLSCLFINKPRVVDWPDCGGSVARYYACLPVNKWDKELQNEIESRVSKVQSVNDLKNSGFLDLLETGEYEFEKYKGQPTGIIYNTILYNSNETIHLWTKKQFGNHRADTQHFLNSFYPYGLQLMFTQPFESLNPERIKHYEDVIKKGERPIAIAIRVMISKQENEDSYQDTSYNSTKYVLDGHHKLVAYQNLGIAPNFILINRTNNGTINEYDESFLPNLKPYLFYFQIEHIINNGLGTMQISPDLTKFVDEFINDTPRLIDNLIQLFHSSANYVGYESDPIKKEWFQKRLNLMIDRIENRNKGLYLDYYTSKHPVRKFDKVNNWKEVLELMKEQL